MKLIIDRRVWLRGESMSALLRVSTQTRCCVGIYLSALGVPDEALAGNPTAYEVNKFIPESAEWLLGERCENSDDANDLYGNNDYRSLDPATREQMIAAIFARHGVEVEFQDGGDEVGDRIPSYSEDQ